MGEPIQFENESEGFLYANTIYPVFGRHGNIQKLAIYTRDVTDQRRAVEALRESEEKFRSISSSAQDALIMMNNRGNITYWNEAAERIFGYTKKEAIDRDLHRLLVPKKYLEAFTKGFENFKETGQGSAIGKTMERNFPWNFPCLLFNSRANGMLWELFEISPIERRLKKNGYKRKNWKGYSKWPALPATN